MRQRHTHHNPCYHWVFWESWEPYCTQLEVHHGHDIAFLRMVPREHLSGNVPLHLYLHHNDCHIYTHDFSYIRRCSRIYKECGAYVRILYHDSFGGA